MAARVLGAIANVPVGTEFPSRAALAQAGVHRPLQAGIAGTEAGGAESVVLSGGYLDDIDEGEVIIYTGQGGQDPNTRQQIADQEFRRGNLALAVSADRERPARDGRVRAGQTPAPPVPRTASHAGCHGLPRKLLSPPQSSCRCPRL